MKTMDFFESQASARRKTGLLIFYYLAAVILIILSVYAVFLLIFNFSPDKVSRIWIPGIFFPVAGVTTLILIGGSLYKISLLSSGGDAVAKMLGGQRLESGPKKLEEKRLVNIVEEMAIASGLPVPGIYILYNENSINAFAAGFSSEDAVIGVTKGTLENLSRDELQGVIAHEFSHILNGDMRLNIKLIGVLHGILLISLLGYSLLRSSLYRSGRQSSSGKDNQAGPLLLGLGLMAIGYIGVFFGNLIKSAVSREREYLADASAVQFTRNPNGIADALSKIAGFSSNSTMENKNAIEASHLFFASSISGRFQNLMATHPPIEERIKSLRPETEMFDRNKNKSVQVPSKSSPGQGPYSSLSLGLAPSSVSSTVGKISTETLSYASDILENIPPQLLEMARSPDNADGVIHALLLSDDKKIKKIQMDILDENQVLDIVMQAARNLKSLPEESRLPVLEIAISSLKKITPKKYSSFKIILSQMIDADGMVSLFEYLVRGMVLRHLEPSFGRTINSRVKYYSLRAVEKEAKLLLAAMAEAGLDNESDQKQAYISGVSALGLPIEEFQKGAGSLSNIDAALAKLNKLSFPLKKKLIDASAKCALSDNFVTIRQLEILRITSDAIG
ncbi:MAG: M48 family metallopeptidase, partial [Elusimicrobia bacterium]|nr:M48 family metallopeptidase [Elusimicrobiota bacterium]